jgi:hypothetical protein
MKVLEGGIFVLDPVARPLHVASSSATFEARPPGTVHWIAIREFTMSDQQQDFWSSPALENITQLFMLLFFKTHTSAVLCQGLERIRAPDDLQDEGEGLAGWIPSTPSVTLGLCLVCLDSPKHRSEVDRNWEWKPCFDS